jgi:hypothetical protein
MLVSYSSMTMVQYEGHQRYVQFDMCWSLVWHVLISGLEVAMVKGGCVAVLCFVVHIDVLIQ